VSSRGVVRQIPVVCAKSFLVVDQVSLAAQQIAPVLAGHAASNSARSELRGRLPRAGYAKRASCHLCQRGRGGAAVVATLKPVNCEGSA